MKSVIASAILIAIVFLANYPTESQGHCCVSKCKLNCMAMNGMCDDCTVKTPCCGKGKCNPFCCKCKGDCRTGVGCVNCNCPKRAWDSLYGNEYNQVTEEEQLQGDREHIDEIMAEADTDGDHMINLPEFQDWLQSQPDKQRILTNVKDEFKQLDVNNDGYISRKEID